MIIFLPLIFPSILAVVYSIRINRANFFWIWALTAIGLCLLIPVGSRDFHTYITDYSDVMRMPLTEILSKDSLFSLITYIAASIGIGASYFFLITSALSFGLKGWAISRLTQKSSIAMLMYASSYLFVHEFTQIRVSIAIGIWMLAISFLPTSRKKYLGFTVLASLIHFQAAIGLLIPCLVSITRRKFGKPFIIGLVSCVLILAPTRIFDHLGDSLIKSIPDPRTEIYFAMKDSMEWVRPNPYSIMCLLAFSTMIALFYQERKNRRNLDLISIKEILAVALACGVVVLVLFSQLPVAAFRLSEFFFSVIPAALALAIDNQNKKFKLAFSTSMTILFIYIFLFHSSYLINPFMGGSNE